MNSTQLITKAKAKLNIKHPYFGMLASRLKTEENNKVSFYASNGVKFLYNKEFIESCNIDEISFILTNAVMHHILAYQERKLHRKGTLWQVATDYAINNILYLNGLTIPKGANFNKEYLKMYAEEIYELLQEEAQVNLYEDNKDNSFKNSSNITNLNEEIENEWEYASNVSKQIVLKKSSMPLGLERLAKKVKNSGVDWRFELYNAINRHMRNNYAFLPPNKKHLHRGFILPSLTSDTLSLSVAIDTSGSIDESLLSLFIEEFKSIMVNFPAVNIELLICDARIQGHYSFQGSQELNFPIKGGGGTDYRPVFDFIEANLPTNTMLLYFTDGDGIFPKIPPSYEVLWALSRKAKLPFGRALTLLNN